MSEGCGFESRHHLLDGHFFTYMLKNCKDLCLQRPTVNDKKAEVGQFF